MDFSQISLKKYVDPFKISDRTGSWVFKLVKYYSFHSNTISIQTYLASYSKPHLHVYYYQANMKVILLYIAKFIMRC